MRFNLPFSWQFLVLHWQFVSCLFVKEGRLIEIAELNSPLGFERFPLVISSICFHIDQSEICCWIKLSCE